MIFALGIGTVAGWATFLGLIVFAFILWRGGGGAALNTLQTANHVLEHEVDRLRTAEATHIKRIAELEQQTSLEPILEQLTKLFMQHDSEERVVWTAHEDRAQDRHDVTVRSQEAMLTVLDLIAGRLGPDNGH